MAVRTGAGTGVIVSLVVFVLTTVFLLVLTIVFYAGKTKEMQNARAANDALEVYVAKNQRSADQYKNFEASARERRMSVAQYLDSRYNDLLGYVAAQSNVDLPAVKNEFARFQMKEGDNLRAAMQTLDGNLKATRSENDGLKEQLASSNAQVAEKEAQLQQANEACETRVQGCEAQIASYRDAAEDYRKRLETAIDELNRAKDTLRNTYETNRVALEDEIDRLGQDNLVLKGKVQEFERMRAESTYRAAQPELQVDARIIDVPSGNDQVFVDRGKKDRIVLGMTFEVYSDSMQIRVNPQTGEVPRGKASLQVTKVNDTTSVCKVTRSSPGQPVVRGDVVANAVYDPKQQYKFLVHGKFDVDLDSKPTETEAEYLRSLVLQWGGTVVSGEELPGDLDFLVMGAQPPNPVPPPNDAPQARINDYIKQKEAFDLYKRLFESARDAQIPVLNANRFFILTGFVER